MAGLQPEGVGVVVTQRLRAGPRRQPQHEICIASPRRLRWVSLDVDLVFVLAGLGEIPSGLSAQPELGSGLLKPNGHLRGKEEIWAVWVRQNEVILFAALGHKAEFFGEDLLVPAPFCQTASNHSEAIRRLNDRLDGLDVC